LRPDPVGVRSAEKSLRVTAARVGESATVELEGLPVTGLRVVVAVVEVAAADGPSRGPAWGCGARGHSHDRKGNEA